MRWSVILVAVLAHEVRAQVPPPRPPRLPIPQTDLKPIVLEPEAEPPDPTLSPNFVLIDRFDASSAASIEVTFIDLDGTSDQLVRSQISGRYVDPRKNLGAYLQLPASSGTGDFTNAVGNLEIGGLLLRKNAGGPTNAFVLHAGVTLPTGSLDGDNIRAALVKPADVYLALPGATSLRLGASSLFRNRNVFGRVDLGFDVNFDIRGSSETVDPIIRLNAGFGVDLGPMALMGEVSNAYVVNGSDETHEEKLINVAALSLRVTAGPVRPYISFVVPFDGDSSELLDFAFTIGLEAKLWSR